MILEGTVLDEPLLDPCTATLASYVQKLEALTPHKKATTPSLVPETIAAAHQQAVEPVKAQGNLSQQHTSDSANLTTKETESPRVVSLLGREDKDLNAGDDVAESDESVQFIEEWDK